MIVFKTNLAGTKRVLGQVEVLQHKHLYNFVEVLNGGLVKVFFVVLHSVPHYGERSWYQVKDWNTWWKEKTKSVEMMATLLEITIFVGSVVWYVK